MVREDDTRKDLLFAGTETGLYISWNGGKDWSPFQLNLPVAPITDLRIHQGNLIAATSGRSFWILDDVSLLRQYKKDATALSVFQPSPAYLVNGSSELDETGEDFEGLDKFRGVNPSTGVVIYYQLPEINDSALNITMEIKDTDGNLVRTFTSKADSNFKKYDGGPKADPLLSKVKGLNRIVWNMRYATIPGVYDIYMDCSYKGHKASPGKYSITLKMGEKNVSTEAEILANPLYTTTTAATYKEYNTVMSGMEAAVTNMHQMVTNMNAKREQLALLIASLAADSRYNTLRTEGLALSKKMKAWDDDMVQRKSKAYDDAENFPNKFTSNYMFLHNQTESEIPGVNKASLDLLATLNTQWLALKSRADEILDKDIPGFNKLLWDAGVGAIWTR